MAKPNVLIFAGYGLNCEEETRYAFELAGAKGTIVHINDLVDGLDDLNNYQIIAFPGGFSYGDDTGSGNAYANKVRNHLWDSIQAFVSEDRLVLGVCNGFQILVNLGLLPAMGGNYGERQVALVHNDSARYLDRWVDLKVDSKTPWLTGISTLSLPIAHGEGKLYADAATLKKLKAHKQIALRYTEGEICKSQNLPANPNGSLDDIAALTDETGRILGMMPHPERALFTTQLPQWPLLAEQSRRKEANLPTFGPGKALFDNAVRYFA